jgi:Immunity protein Imm1
MTERHVMLLTGDRWEGGIESEWRHDNPTAEQLDSALARMDAEVYTLITLGGSGNSHLCVGGGAGAYVVYVTFDNLDFWNLISPGGVVDRVAVVAGGQEGEYAAEQVVDLESTRVAAHAFLAGQGLAPGLRWKRQI